MEIRLDPRAEEILRRPVRTDWKAIAERVRQRANSSISAWQLVHVGAGYDSNIAELKAHIEERLRAHGCRAQVVALHGIGEGPRPWQGFAVFARCPPDPGQPGAPVRTMRRRVLI
jgi:hypothetical protein